MEEATDSVALSAAMLAVQLPHTLSLQTGRATDLMDCAAFLLSSRQLVFAGDRELIVYQNAFQSSAPSLQRTALSYSTGAFLFVDSILVEGEQRILAICDDGSLVEWSPASEGPPLQHKLLLSAEDEVITCANYFHDGMIVFGNNHGDCYTVRMKMKEGRKRVYVPEKLICSSSGSGSLWSDWLETGARLIGLSGQRGRRNSEDGSASLIHILPTTEHLLCFAREEVVVWRGYRAGDGKEQILGRYPVMLDIKQDIGGDKRLRLVHLYQHNALGSAAEDGEDVAVISILTASTSSLSTTNTSVCLWLHTVLIHVGGSEVGSAVQVTILSRHCLGSALLPNEETVPTSPLWPRIHAPSEEGYRLYVTFIHSSTSGSAGTLHVHHLSVLNSEMTASPTLESENQRWDSTITGKSLHACVAIKGVEGVCVVIKVGEGAEERLASLHLRPAPSLSTSSASSVVRSILCTRPLQVYSVDAVRSFLLTCLQQQHSVLPAKSEAALIDLRNAFVVLPADVVREVVEEVSRGILDQPMEGIMWGLGRDLHSEGLVYRIAAGWEAVEQRVQIHSKLLGLISSVVSVTTVWVDCKPILAGISFSSGRTWRRRRISLPPSSAVAALRRTWQSSIAHRR